MLRTTAYVAAGLAGLVVVVAGILIYAATRPDSFRVQRSISIKAPPEKVFTLINDLRDWSKWSPYEKKDPGMKRTFSGASSGKGAVDHVLEALVVVRERFKLRDELVAST